MSRDPSYNAIVRAARERLELAAVSVHQSRGHDGLGHHHDGCCYAITFRGGDSSSRLDNLATVRAQTHFRNTYYPDVPVVSGIGYWFGEPTDIRDRRTAERRINHRIYALLLAAASLD